MMRLFLQLCMFVLPLALAATPRQVLIVSYAEPDSNYNLTAVGADRAGQLPQYFDSLSAQGFGPPEVILGAQRTQIVTGGAVFQTATPSSGEYQTPIHVFSPNDLSGLVNTVMTHSLCDQKCVLIVWDFASIPDLIAALGYETPSLPSPPCYALTYVLPQFPVSGYPAPTVLNQGLISGDYACGGVAPPTPPTPDAVAGYVPIVFYNGTTSAIVQGTPQPIPDSEIFVLVMANGGAQVVQFTNDGSGHMLGALTVPSPTPGNGASYYASYYSYPLTSLQSLGSGYYACYIASNVLQNATRMMISVVNPIDWLIVPSSGAILSQDDSFVTTDDTYYTLYDKVEFTVTNASLPWWQFVMNSTMVDYYCLPLSFYIDYTSGGSPTTSYTGISPTISRQNVFSTFSSAVAALTNGGAGTWTTLYTTYTPPAGSAIPLRIASANSATLKPFNTAPLFPANYLSVNPNATCNWMQQIWFNTGSPPLAYYQVGGTNTLTVDLTNAGAGSGTATGSVDANQNFVFTLNSDSIWYPGTVTFQPPATIAPFFSGAYTDYVNPATGNTPLYSFSGSANTTTVEAIWQIFSCAYNVGFVPPPSTIGTPTSPLTKAWLQSQVSSFFQDNPNLCVGPWYNFYSKVLHDNFAITPYDHFYTAPFDDFLGIDGTITVDDITGVNAGMATYLTVGDLTNTVIPNILDDATTYNVSFAILPSGVQNVMFNGVPVPSAGGPMGTATGSSMTLALQYTAGAYSTSPPTTFTVQLSPSTGCTVPKLPSGSNLVLSGTDLTVYIGTP